MAVAPNSNALLPALTLQPLPQLRLNSPGVRPQFEWNCQNVCPDGSCGDANGCPSPGGSCSYICPDGSCYDVTGCLGTFGTGVPRPPGTGAGGPTPTTPVGTNPGTGSGSSSNTACTNIFTAFLHPMDCLLRLVFLVLGLICIAGAIYLFKPTAPLIKIPLKVARRGAQAATEGAAAGAAAA